MIIFMFCCFTNANDFTLDTSSVRGITGKDAGFDWTDINSFLLKMTMSLLSIFVNISLTASLTSFQSHGIFRDICD